MRKIYQMPKVRIITLPTIENLMAGSNETGCRFF